MNFGYEHEQTQRRPNMYMMQMTLTDSDEYTSIFLITFPNSDLKAMLNCRENQSDRTMSCIKGDLKKLS